MKPPRQTSIDYMKALLVIGMILAHALQLLSSPRGVLWLFSTVINLITFSGFFFCFGYVFYLVYLSRPAGQVRGKLAKTAGKTLTGYYISALASAILMDQPASANSGPTLIGSLTDIVTLMAIPRYSEFLLAFFLITGLVLLGFGAFKRLLNLPWLMVGISAVSLLTATLLPASLLLPNALGLLVGTRSYAVYPIVQYLPIFLAGLYFAKNGIVWHWLVFGLSMAGTGLFVGYYAVTKEMPSGFLPSVYWLVGSYGILYAYFLLVNWLERKAIRLPPLLSIGQNTLLYLILSNVFLFALRTKLTLEPGAALLTGVVILLAINFLISLVTQPAGTEKQAPKIAPAVPVS